MMKEQILAEWVHILQHQSLIIISHKKFKKKIIDKTISSLRDEGIVFKGFLYAGIMLKDGEPFVLEYNVRMGDPECQPILMRMDSNLFEYLAGKCEWYTRKVTTDFMEK